MVGVRSDTRAGLDHRSTPLGQLLLQLPEVLVVPTSGAVHLDPAVDTVLHVHGGPGYRGTSCACSSSCMGYSWPLIQQLLPGDT